MKRTLHAEESSGAKQAKVHKTTELELLPADMMFEILLRLPVKALARCRRVCRGWRDLIDSCDFAKSHSNSPLSLLMLCHLPFNEAYDVVDLSSLCNNASSPLAFKELPVPGGHFPDYVGNCNGLVCIRDAAAVLVWNPATGKQFRFGLPPTEGVWNWGFGYDEDSDDYKVAALGWPDTAAETGDPLWIYSLRSRSWNCVNKFPYRHVGFGTGGVFVCGALHYPVSHPETNADSIGALHLGKLEYSIIPTPDCYSSGNMCLEYYFGPLDGRLCVVLYYGDVDECELWTMKEYGVKESWTKLIRFTSDQWRFIPLTYLEDEEVFLFKIGSSERNEYDVIVGYEIRKRSFGRPYEFRTRSSEKLKGGHWSFRPYFYVPSLVSPQIGI